MMFYIILFHLSLNTLNLYDDMDIMHGRFAACIESFLSTSVCLWVQLKLIFMILYYVSFYIAMFSYNILYCVL